MTPASSAPQIWVNKRDYKEHKKARQSRASHQEVGFLLVGVDVLGDPLRQKLNCRKQRTPRQIYKKSIGVSVILLFLYRYIIYSQIFTRLFYTVFVFDYEFIVHNKMTNCSQRVPSIRHECNCNRTTFFKNIQINFA